jgi:hypothetical protein
VGRAGIGAVATPASSATVGRVKMSRADSWSPAARARDTTLIARMESPPSAIRLAVTLTRSRPSTSAQMPARVRSVSVRGSTCRSSATVSGAGSALRSTLPLALIGSRSIVTNRAGTM